MPDQAMTVLGPVERQSLGWVLPHEHVTIDNRVHLSPRDEMPVDTPVHVTNLRYVKRCPRALADNIVMDDDEAALDDLRAYAVASGGAIVELTPRAMGRDVEKLRWFSESAGVHVVASTAYYVYQGHKGHVVGRSVTDIAGEFVRDLVDGPVRCGAIGEIGVSAEPFDDELKVVQAGLSAQALTGALLQLASEGCSNQLLMSHDVCQKMQLTSRGGFGYAHILTRVVPLLKALGASDDLIHQMGVETPARLLCWV